MARITLYTRSYCPYCVRAQAILHRAGIEDYEEISIDGREAELRREIMARTGRWDVPQAFIGDRYIGDDDALAALAQTGELQRLLAEEDRPAAAD